MLTVQIAHRFTRHCGLALCALTLGLAPVLVPAAHAATPAAAKKATKSSKSGKAKAAPVAAEPQEEEPDTTGSTSTDFDCELGNKLTIYRNAEDDSHIALRWKKRLHRLVRVGTTTGATRFENRTFGLVWIGIPAKGILLDSKLNRQLANECKDAEQAKPVVVPAVLQPAPVDAKPAGAPAAPATPVAPVMPVMPSASQLPPAAVEAKPAASGQ